MVPLARAGRGDPLWENPVCQQQGAHYLYPLPGWAYSGVHREIKRNGRADLRGRVFQMPPELYCQYVPGGQDEWE